MGAALGGSRETVNARCSSGGSINDETLAMLAALPIESHLTE
jgi:hypothetical protein